MVVQEKNLEEMAGLVALGTQLGVDTVYFHQLANWGTFSDEEYERRAVHRPSHRDTASLVATLRDTVFDNALVYLDDLTHVREAALAGGRSAAV